MHKGIGPLGAFDNQVWQTRLSLVPEDAEAVTAVLDKLVTVIVVAQLLAIVLVLLGMVDRVWEGWGGGLG